MENKKPENKGYQPLAPFTKPFTEYGELYVNEEDTHKDIEDIYNKKINTTCSVEILTNFLMDIYDNQKELTNENKTHKGKKRTRISNIDYNFKKLLRMCYKKYKVQPKKRELLYMYRKLVYNKKIKETEIMNEVLITKRVRNKSGVSVVTVFTSPFPVVNGVKKEFSCQWDCDFCPDQPGQPRSYLREEPGVLRANTNRFDAVFQFTDRVKTLNDNGHAPDKIEVLVLGGTWESYDWEYQVEFIRDLFFAANTYFNLEKRDRYSLKKEQEINENSKCKIIGLTLETRPDTVSKKSIKKFRYLGCTRLQIGVQHTSDNVLGENNRKCTDRHTRRAIKLLKDSCYKIDVHLMPNLPGSSVEKDNHMFYEFINNEAYQVDQWKIYPTAVTRWTKIATKYEKGEYKPYNDYKLINLLLQIKNKVKPWVRLNRIVRDIPSKYILHGFDIPNLRQELEKRLKDENKTCDCIRCCEIKNSEEYNENPKEILKKAKFKTRNYWSSGALEIHLTYEYETPIRNYVFGFLRLRLPDTFSPNNIKKENYNFFEELKGCSYIRELHVYGKTQTVTKRNIFIKKILNSHTSQHSGFGTKLLKKAEEISINYGYKRCAVISGIGTREYYKKFDYILQGKGEFMIKNLNKRYNIFSNIFIIFIIGFISIFIKACI